MRNVFLIGKFNVAFEGINSYLSSYFNVQVCVDNLELIKGMLKLNRPDVIVVSLTDLYADQVAILTELKESYSGIPVICVGVAADPMAFAGTLNDEYFYVLTPPVSNDMILEVIYKVLHIEYEVEDSVIGKAYSKRKCVLLIDDSHLQLRAMNEMLKGKYDVQMATSGVKALTLIGQRLPDIIFLDYDMPVCDGRMTLQMIREIKEAKDIPVIFLTGVKDREHIQAVLELHPAGYLLKPASARMIYAALQKHLY
ncbi:MAG: response regulator [Lachnospiraceae bacterium]|nr:response regulator [Lachnospiraceae bacterium]